MVKGFLASETRLSTLAFFFKVVFPTMRLSRFFRGILLSLAFLFRFIRIVLRPPMFLFLFLLSEGGAVRNESEPQSSEFYRSTRFSCVGVLYP